jgi:hypothetical protein
LFLYITTQRAIVKLWHQFLLQGPLKLTNADGGNKTSAQKERRGRQPPRERMKIEKIRPSPPADSSSVDTSASEPEVAPVDVKKVYNEGTLEKGEKATDDLKTDGSGTVVNTMVEVQLMEKNSFNATVDGVTHSNSEIAVESYSSIPSEKSGSNSSSQTAKIDPVINLERDSAVAVTEDRNVSELPNTEVMGKPEESKKENVSDSPESIEDRHEQKSDSISVKEQDQLEEVRHRIFSLSNTQESCTSFH